jgi:hypothetical protein
MVLQFYFFLNHVLHKIKRTSREHYGENPYQTPYIIIINLILTPPIQAKRKSSAP